MGLRVRLSPKAEPGLVGAVMRGNGNLAAFGLWATLFRLPAPAKSTTLGEKMTVSLRKRMWRVTAWTVESDKFNGIVYSPRILLDKVAEANEYTVQMIYLYRGHEPMPHVIYEEC